MDLRKLKSLIDLVSESGISELEVTEGESKVRVVKQATTAYTQPLPSAEPFAASHQPGTTLPSPATAAAPASVVTAPQDYLFKSEMVGIFYRASAQGANPFVQIGDTVKKGQTLCIIEAMKLFHEIKAEEEKQEGVIKAILVEDGQIVEYAQPLFVISKATH